MTLLMISSPVPALAMLTDIGSLVQPSTRGSNEIVTLGLAAGAEHSAIEEDADGGRGVDWIGLRCFGSFGCDCRHALGHVYLIVF